MKNLAILRKKKGLTQMQFAKMLGVSTSTVAMWETGQRKPDYHMIIRICDFFAIGFEELLGLNNYVQPLQEDIAVPVLGSVRGGAPSTAEENITGYEMINSALASSGEIFALTVRGHSMEPKISPGDRVIVRRQSSAENGQVAVVLVGREEATIKKVFFHKDGITLVPTNPDFTPIFYTAQECENLPVTIAGVVVERRSSFL